MFFPLQFAHFFFFFPPPSYLTSSVVHFALVLTSSCYLVSLICFVFFSVVSFVLAVAVDLHPQAVVVTVQMALLSTL